MPDTHQKNIMHLSADTTNAVGSDPEGCRLEGRRGRAAGPAVPSGRERPTLARRLLCHRGTGQGEATLSLLCYELHSLARAACTASRSARHEAQA